MKINKKISHIRGHEKGPAVGWKWYLNLKKVSNGKAYCCNILVVLR